MKLFIQLNISRTIHSIKKILVLRLWIQVDLSHKNKFYWKSSKNFKQSVFTPNEVENMLHQNCSLANTWWTGLFVCEYFLLECHCLPQSRSKWSNMPNCLCSDRRNIGQSKQSIEGLGWIGASVLNWITHNASLGTWAGRGLSRQTQTLSQVTITHTRVLYFVSNETPLK